MNRWKRRWPSSLRIISDFADSAREGGDFTPQDTKSSQRVVIVSETFVNRYWPNQEALGQAANSDLTHEWFTVVGVARDSKVNGLNESPPHSCIFRNIRSTARPWWS
jgi:hypothetical protein